MDDILDFIHQVSLCYLVGRILVIFYKKSFSIQVHLKQVVTDSFAISFALGVSYTLLPRSLGSIAVAIALGYAIAIQLKDELLKNLAYSITLYIGFYASFTETTFSSIPLILATTQFLRKPDRLRELLREPRILFGPIYVIMMSAGLRFCPFQHLDRPIVITTILAVLCTIVATVFLRPDNNQLLQLVLPESKIPSPSTRQVLHGYLLFAGHIITFFKVVFLMTEPPPIPLVAGLVNVILFIWYKLSKVFVYIN